MRITYNTTRADAQLLSRRDAFGAAACAIGLGAAPLEQPAIIALLSATLTTALIAERAVFDSIKSDTSRASEELMNEAFGRTREVIDRIIALRTPDLKALRLKLRALRWCYTGSDAEIEEWQSEHRTTDARILASIVSDLLAHFPHETAA